MKPEQTNLSDHKWGKDGVGVAGNLELVTSNCKDKLIKLDGE